MKVTLIQATENAGQMIADIASICYGKNKAKNPERLLRSLYELKHDSVFEHAFYTFKIEGISRACLSQLSRHRLISMTVESQRYTKYDNGLNVVDMPQLDGKANKKYIEALAEASINYNELLKLGVKPEDARMVLPNATATNLYMSCNLRELLHIYKVRTSKGAQQEIKDLARELARLVIEKEPGLEFMFKE